MTPQRANAVWLLCLAVAVAVVVACSSNAASPTALKYDGSFGPATTSTTDAPIEDAPLEATASSKDAPIEDAPNEDTASTHTGG